MISNFIYFVLFLLFYVISLGCNNAFSYTTLLLPFFLSLSKYSQIPHKVCTYIIDYEYKYTSCFTLLFIVKPLERKSIFLFQQITGFFFHILYCYIKKGIFYYQTSTSFVLDCANNHDHNRQFHQPFGPFNLLEQYVLRWEKKEVGGPFRARGNVFASLLHFIFPLFVFVWNGIILFGRKCQKDYIFLVHDYLFIAVLF